MDEKLTRCHADQLIFNPLVYRADDVDALVRSLWALVEEMRTATNLNGFAPKHITPESPYSTGWTHASRQWAREFASLLPAPPPEEP